MDPQVTPGRILLFRMKDFSLRPLIAISASADNHVTGVVLFNGPADADNWPNGEVHEADGVKQLCTGLVVDVPPQEVPHPGQWEITAGSWSWPVLPGIVDRSAFDGSKWVEHLSAVNGLLSAHSDWFRGEVAKLRKDLGLDGSPTTEAIADLAQVSTTLQRKTESGYSTGGVVEPEMGAPANAEAVADLSGDQAPVVPLTYEDLPKLQAAASTEPDKAAPQAG